MIDYQAIVQVCDQIAREFRRSQIILFGSHAYGAPEQHSDVDLLVVVKRGLDGYRKAAEISDRVHPAFAMDLLVRTEKELHKRIAMNDFFLKEIVDKGIVLYDSIDARVGKQGRKRLQQRQAFVSSAKIGDARRARNLPRSV